MDVKVRTKEILVNQRQNVLIFLALLALLIGFGSGSPYFLSSQNLLSMLVSAVPLALIAIGECICLLNGYFDMSPGMVASLSGVIWAMLIRDVGMNTWLALALALGFGLLSGSIAGLSVAYLNMPAWMATYALFQIWRGIIHILTEGKAIRMANVSEFKIIGQTTLFGSKFFTLPVLIMLLLYLIVHLMLKYTRTGRSMYIIGGNIEAAKNVGIPVRHVQYLSFVITGLLAALAGALFASRSASAQPIIGEMYVMQAIAAAVVGGTRMGGGKANMGLTFVGVMIVVAIQNGLNMIGVPSFYQYIAMGATLFIAVLIQSERVKL